MTKHANRKDAPDGGAAKRNKYAGDSKAQAERDRRTIENADRIKADVAGSKNWQDPREHF